MQLSPDALEALREAMLDAVDRADVRAAVHNVYRALQDQIDLRRPICRTSGRCCRFDEFGHRLFVTTMELSTFLHDLRGARAASGFAVTTRDQRPDACPFQVSNLCSVHQIRPFGCRIFFCDETSADWQQRQYEFFHAELKRLHGRLDVPYFYVEWRQALRALGPALSLAQSSL